MLEIIGIVLFALLIVASIALHEVGHMVPAKKFGVKVTEYMIGFGPTLWSKKKGETDYGVKAVPLGGYVRMIGMLPPPKDAPDGTARRGSTGRLAMMVSDARKSSLEEIGPGDSDRVFYKLNPLRKIIVMLGGPTTNLVLAFVLFTAVFVGIGLPQPTLTLQSVVACTPTKDHPTGGANADGSCPAGTVASPAAAAGLKPGDTITSFNGQSVSTWEAMSADIQANAGKTVTIGLTRDGVPMELPLTIASSTHEVMDSQGNTSTVTTGFLGVRPTSEYVRQSIWSVPGQMWDMAVGSAKALVSMPVRLYELVKDTLIGGEARDMNGPVSVVGVSRLGGDVFAADAPIQAKAATFLGLAASLNLFLFLFNLLPILPLDGGHVAGAAWEGIRRRMALWRGRPDPGPVDVAKMMPVAYVVASVLVVMSVIVIFADLVRPISLG